MILALVSAVAWSLVLVSVARAADVVSWDGGGEFGLTSSSCPGHAATPGAQAAAIASCWDGGNSATSYIRVDVVYPQSFASGAYASSFKWSAISNGNLIANGTGTLTGTCTPVCEGETPASGWSSTSMMMQALFVLGVVGLFFMGYRTGRTA